MADSENLAYEEMREPSLEYASELLLRMQRLIEERKIIRKVDITDAQHGGRVAVLSREIAVANKEWQRVLQGLDFVEEC